MLSTVDLSVDCVDIKYAICVFPNIGLKQGHLHLSVCDLHATIIKAIARDHTV